MGECQSTSTLPRSSYAALDSGNRVLLRELAAVVNRLLSGEEMTLRKLIGPLFRSSGPDRSFHSSVRLRNCGSQPQCGGRTHAVSSDFESDPSTHPGLGHLDSGRFPHASELAVETSEPSPCRAPTATGGVDAAAVRRRVQQTTQAPRSRDLRALVQRQFAASAAL
jgi:hypothetical protein